MKKIILFICLCGFSVFAGNTADSLKLCLTKATGKGKVKIFNLLSVDCRLSEPPKAIQYAEMALACAIKANDSLGMATALKNSGIAWYFVGNYKNAIPQMKKALVLFEVLSNKSGISACVNNLGLFLNDNGDYKNALLYFEKSLKIDAELKDTEGVASSMNNIGMVYQNQGNHVKALEYYFKAIDLGKATGDEESVAECWINVGAVYEENKKYGEAIQAYTDAHAILKKYNNRYKDAICLNNMGLINHNLKEYAKALSYINQSLAIRVKINDTMGIAACMENLSSVYDALGDTIKANDCFFKTIGIEMKLGLRKRAARSLSERGLSLVNKQELEKAINYFKNSLELATEIKAAPEIRDDYKYLSEVYAAKKDYENAYKYSSLYSVINDSLLQLNSGLFSTDGLSILLKDSTSSKSKVEKDTEASDNEFNRMFKWAFFVMFIVAMTLFIRERRKNT